MTGPLVETKLFSPAPRAGIVARPRLNDRLSQNGRLVLVSAPAGFGKTTLVGGWLTRAHRRDAAVAWVSLDEGDQEAASFWTYVVTALDRAVPGVGAGALPMLEAGQSTEAVLVVVLNELSVLPDEVTLVLDDYHLADGPGIRSGMTFFARPSAAAGATRHHDPCGSRPAAGPAACPRRARRGPRRRPAFHRAEAATYLNDVDRPAPHRRGHRVTRGAHRRVDRGPATRRAVAPGP